jgi:hypothetical protein
MRIDNEQLTSLFIRANEYRERHGTRLGQAMFNVLDDIEQGLAREIAGEDIDPYYNDDNIPAFIEYLVSEG